MIYIGLTTFADHPSLAVGSSNKATLRQYSAHFPLVELDSPFYGIPKPEVVMNWQRQVHLSFQFIVKASATMTQHETDGDSLSSPMEEFRKFRMNFRSMLKTNQLKTVLFQFPPYFQRDLKSIEYLRYIRKQLPDYPISVEFRNSSWYGGEISPDVAKYLHELKMTLVVVDEPYTNVSSVPFVPMANNPEVGYLRLHGKNVTGWQNQSKDRTLYRYSHEELLALSEDVKEMAQKVKDLVVVFNNNAGHDAADNAEELQKILNITYNDLSPLQLDLF